MSKEQTNMIEYLVCVIGAFARQFSLTNAKAYQYLRQYKGLDFLTKHYGVEHTQSIEDAVEDIALSVTATEGRWFYETLSWLEHEHRGD